MPLGERRRCFKAELSPRSSTGCPRWRGPASGRNPSAVRHGRRAHRYARPFHWRRARGQTPSSTLRSACRWCPTPVALVASVFARSRGPALFWRVAIGNAAVLAAACTITALVFSPSVEDVAVRELAIFAGGLALMLALNLLLLRRALAPLRELTAFARRIDPLEPGRRLEVGGGDSEAAELDRRVQRDARAARGRAARQRRPRARRAGGRAAARRAGAPRRRRPDADRRRAAARPRRPRRAGRRAARASSRRRRPPAAASRRCAGSPAGCGPRRSTTSAWRARCSCSASASPSTPGSTVDVHVQPGLPEFGGDAELVALPRRPGGADQRRPPRGRAPRRGAAGAGRRPAAARGRRRRHAASRPTASRAAACAACASARC